MTPMKAIELEFEKVGDFYNECRELEFCCGVLEIGDFDTVVDNAHEMLSIELTNALEDFKHNTAVKLYAKAIVSYIVNTILERRSAIYVATTAKPSKPYTMRLDQEAAVIALKRLGFKPVASNINKNSNNIVTMWVVTDDAYRKIKRK